MEVKSITIKHLVMDEFTDQIKDDTYFVCMNESCNIVYFSTDLDIVYSKDQIKVPIWFKEDANPKYLCYCNKVTEQQIKDAVLYDGAKDMKDIIRITGAMKNGDCVTKNPLGKCCSPYIQDVINKALTLYKPLET